MTDTSPIILAVIGTGITLLGILVGLQVSLFRWLRQDIQAIRQDVNSRHKDLRQDMAALRQDIKGTNARFDSLEEKINARIDALRQEMRTDIGALHSRIDNLYQALFNHKDPAA